MINKNIQIRSILLIVEGLTVYAIFYYLGGSVLFWYLRSLFTDWPVFTISALTTSIASVFLTVTYLRLRLHFQFELKLAQKHIIGTCIAILILLGVVLTVAYLFGLNDWTIRRAVNVPAPYLILNMLLVALIGPVLEEILFRGYFYKIIKDGFGYIAAIMITSTLFVIPHLILSSLNIIAYGKGVINIMDLLIGFVILLIYSTMFTIMNRYWGLLSAILAHVIVNSAMVLLYMMRSD